MQQGGRFGQGDESSTEAVLSDSSLLQFTSIQPMLSKSTNRYASNLYLQVVLLVLAAHLANGQSECASKPLPPVIPLKLNESVVIDLLDYFQGSNISFAVQPNNTFSWVEPQFNCRDLATQGVGRVVASEYYKQKGVQAVAILAQSGGQFAFYYVLIDKMTATTLTLPYSKCTHFALNILNATHFQPIINCAHPRYSFFNLLVTTIAKLNTVTPKWQEVDAQTFTRNSTKKTMLMYGDILVRGVHSTANSYIQLWNWEALELIAVLDRTFLTLDIFYLQALELYGNVLLVLDYHSGIYAVRITPTNKFGKTVFYPLPFYEQFWYNPTTGVLFLGKKGKVVSTTIRNLDYGSFIVGQSYNLFKYEPVSKIIEWNKRIFVLSDSFISVFNIEQGQNDYRHYQLYPSTDTPNLFIQQREDEPTLLLLKTNGSTLYYRSCLVKSPLLHLSTPSSAHEIEIIGTSTMQGESIQCSQKFTIERLTTQLDFIYESGYAADNEILFANLPGEGVVQLEKYGIGRNMMYEVIPSNNSKIEYSSRIKKSEEATCAIQNRPIPAGGGIYFSKAWENLLIVQFSSDLSIKYYYCSLSSGVACTYLIELPAMGTIDRSAYQIIEKTATYSISYEVLLQYVRNDTNILVRKLLVQHAAKSLQLSYHCTISFKNSTQDMIKISQLSISNGRLFVVLALRKEIWIYDLREGCPNINNITRRSFPGMYFAPRSVHFDQRESYYRQQMLIVKQWDELLFIRLVGTDLSPVLVSRSTLPSAINSTIVIAHPYLLYFQGDNNQAFTYFLDDNHKLLYLRQLPLYGRKFASRLDGGGAEFSQLLDQNHLALLLNETNNDQLVSIYTIDSLISATAEYQLIALKKGEYPVIMGGLAGQYLLIKLQLIPGPGINYLFCQANETFLNPSVIFNFKQARTALDTYSQNFTLLLKTSNQEINHPFKISLTNIGNAITRGKNFPSRGTSFDASATLEIDDTNWFAGPIYNYAFNCKDCEGRIQFIDKMNKELKKSLPMASPTFEIGRKGQVVNLMHGPFLITTEDNFTAWPLDGQTEGYGLKSAMALTLLSTDCLDSKRIRSDLLVVLCWRASSNGEKKYYLSLVSTASYKGFVLDQTLINLSSDIPPKLTIKDDIIIVHCQLKAVLLIVWSIQDVLQFIQLDQIDNQDISGQICALELISNTTSHNFTNVLYGVIVTQCSSTIYYASFSLQLEQQQIIDEYGNISIFRIPNIHVSYAQNIDLLKLLQQKHIQIPSQARIIQTITWKESWLVPEQEEFSMITVLDKFHSYQFILTLNSKTRIVKRINLDGVFNKYGSNTAVSASLQDYLAIKYILDLGYGKMDELYGCFDLKKYTKNIDLLKEYHVFASYSLKEYKSSNSEEEIPWMMSGNSIYQIHSQHLEVINLNNKLRANISNFNSDNPDDVLYTQSVVVTANNPASARSATIILKAVDLNQLSDLEIALIVVGSIATVLIMAVICRSVIRKVKSERKLVRLGNPQPAEDAQLQQQQQQRAGEWLINASTRGSVQP